MTIVVLVVLVLVWAVVLGPSLLRRTMDRQHKDSIGSFHRQLNVLGRTGPSLMPPAHRLGTSIPGRRGHGDAAGWPVSVSSRPAAPTAQDDGPPYGGPQHGGPQHGGSRYGGSPYGGPEYVGPAALRRSDPYFRRGACKRRRDVLMVLLCTLTVTGLIGIIPAMHVVLMGTALVGVVLAIYIGLLVRLRNQALEREVKLRYLPRSTGHDMSVPVRRTASR